MEDRWIRERRQKEHGDREVKNNDAAAYLNDYRWSQVKARSNP